MRLAAVLAAAVVVVVVVSAAPPSPMRPPSSASAPMLRPKRGNTPPKSATIPYSNYRRVSGVHRPYSAWKQLASVRRYRYPLYRKRSYPAHYDYEDEVFLPEEEVEEDYPSYAPRPSLFRERNMKEEEEEEMAALEEAAKEEAERRENELLLNQGYFHDLPDEDVAGYDYSAPYVLSYPELERLNQLYDMEKEAMDASDQDFPVYAPGRKTMAPTATGRFYDALSYVRKRATEMKPEEPLGVDAATPPRAKKPQQYLTSAAGRYWRVRDEQQQQEAQQKATSASSAVRDPDMMIRKRKKRNTTTATATATTTTTTPAAAKRRKTNTPSTTITTKPKTHAPTTTITTTTALTTTAARRDHRNKRAFSDYFKWEKRGEEEQEEEEEGDAGEEEEDKEVDDYLTREYFKTIARSVGQKRMAYGQFEPDVTEDKRAASTASLQDILSNPETLRMVQDKLREAEMVMAKEAGTGLSQWPRGGTQDEAAQKLLSNLVLRMDAIEHMREVLAQLQHLQEIRAGARVGGRREIQLREEERKRAAAAEHGDWRKTSVAAGGNQKRSVRRRLRRDDIGDLFMGNEREECPVLWWILESCGTVSEKVGDEAQVFLPACIKHEICYVCGASQGISGHECDAVLSSALEASCPTRSLDCLAAAGSTFTALSRPAAYDPAGSCANDPCVIHFLEAR